MALYDLFLSQIEYLSQSLNMLLSTNSNFESQGEFSGSQWSECVDCISISRV
jgi:hypothetical protein